MKRIKLFEQFMNEKKGDTYEYGCVMLYFDMPQMNKIHDAIDPKDLYEEEDDRTYGIEDEPHCTLLYGLHEEVSTEMIKEIIGQFNFSDLILHNASLFENQYDVLKFDVKYAEEGKDFLHKCNAALTDLPHTNSYPDYHPHCTIAYIKKGLGKKYVDVLKGQEFKVATTHVIYSKPDGEKVKINIY